MHSGSTRALPRNIRAPHAEPGIGLGSNSVPGSGVSSSSRPPLSIATCSIGGDAIKTWLAVERRSVMPKRTSARRQASSLEAARIPCSSTSSAWRVRGGSAAGLAALVRWNRMVDPPDVISGLGLEVDEAPRRPGMAPPRDAPACLSPNWGGRSRTRSYAAATRRRSSSSSGMRPTRPWGISSSLLAVSLSTPRRTTRGSTSGSRTSSNSPLLRTSSST